MIDAHQHFWQLDRGDYAWPNDSVAPIFRDFGPADLAPLLAQAGVRQTVLVQANDTAAETDWLLACAADSDFVAAVVGWTDLAAPDAARAIDRLARQPRLRGLRPMLQNIADTGWILRPEVQPALAHLEASGLCFDALIQPRHLPAILTLARRYPALPIVIDHIAKPRMGATAQPNPTRPDPAQPDPDWLAGMQALAGCPNVWCKLSGMVTEIGPGWQQTDLAPFARAVLAAFGAERVIWGSDWPVLNLAADYPAWLATAQALTAHLPPAACAAIFEGNARRFYRLPAAG